MSAVEFPDSDGNVVTLTKPAGSDSVTIFTFGNSAHYLVEDYTQPITYNHLTNVLFDGVRELHLGVETEEDHAELLKALRDLLAGQFEEYNRDLAIAETSDGELVLVSDASAFLTEDEFSFCSEHDNEPEPATADEFSICEEDSDGVDFPFMPAARSCSSGEHQEEKNAEKKNAEVVGCHVKCPSGNLLKTPQKDDEPVCEKDTYCIGVLRAEAPIDVELLVQNNGETAWPEGTYLTCVSGSGFGVPEMQLDKVEVNELVSLSLKSLQKQEASESYWSLTDGMRFFGPLIYMTQI
ncbi:unnamed protein product [Amoebophrya sp. A120]|nr:unnamed protein product [Amoebophrya sp. A120]|eukprot:GSA120T00026069001.1